MLAELTTECGAVDPGYGKCDLIFGHSGYHQEWREEKLWAEWREGYPQPVKLAPRCEGCSHPMSEGTWDAQGRTEQWGRDEDFILRMLRQGREPQAWPIHFSSCDEKCRHSGPGRCRGRSPGEIILDEYPWVECDALWTPDLEVEATWRQVIVRRGVMGAKGLAKPCTCGHEDSDGRGDVLDCVVHGIGPSRFDPSSALHVRPFDLSPENVGLYCTRCWAGLMAAEA